jgi:hypothetical protein
MPSIQQDWENREANPYMDEQLHFDTAAEEHFLERTVPMLNTEQRYAFDQIFASTTAREGKMFFLHGPGSTGKTFLYNTLCHRVRANAWITLCVASSGIAALLLPGGHTAHLTFSIPVETLCETSCCQIDKNSKQADMMREVHLIIWDEAVTQHK